jgi:hypothetical protein
MIISFISEYVFMLYFGAEAAQMCSNSNCDLSSGFRGAWTFAKPGMFSFFFFFFVGYRMTTLDG